jgi:tRNA threonylcarbamoyladenosine modification (KEOPS) complex  Pcc1 subunit
MSLNLGDLLKNNKATLQTENGKIVLRISFDDLVNAMVNGLPEQSRKVVTITHDDKQLIISFDASILSGMVGTVAR